VRNDPSSPGGAERALVALACAALLALNLTTATRFPIPWLDEVMFVDPAANLFFGKGFTSCTWPLQPCDAGFWAGYPPLYPALLYVAMRVFGFGPVSVRIVDYVLATVAVLALWLAVARLGLIATRRARLWLVALLLLGYGMVFCYRSARVDCVGFALAAAIALACSIRTVWLRCGVIALLALLLPLTGLQMLLYAVLMTGLLAVYRGRELRRELVSAAAGLLAGTATLYALYTAAGVWPSFVGDTIRSHSLAGRDFSLARTLRQYHRNFGGMYKDPSFVLLLVLAIDLAARQWSRGEAVARSPLGFALVVVIIIPTALFLTGVYPVYYDWMAYVPVSVGICAAVSAARPGSGRLTQAGLALVCAVGLPLVFSWMAVDWADRDYARVEATLRDAITADDRVYLDYSAYYAVKPRAAAVFTDHSPPLTPSASAAIDALVIRPAELDAVARAVGGRWRATGTTIQSRTGGDAGVSIWGPRYDLAVYRRALDRATDSP
jgi:hypothetical protein